MIKLSIGTEEALGIRKIKTDAPTTTAYMMLGSVCSNKCLFCPQSKESLSQKNLLSRVAWNEAHCNVWAEVDRAYIKKKIKRACMQVVNQPGIINSVLNEVKKAKTLTDTPICISGGVETVADAERIFEAGADRISIALDAATPEVYRRVKGLDYVKRLALLKECARRFPGKIGTHLIVGLGETEEEMTSIIQSMYDDDIDVALFAFTPIKGTPMEEIDQPPVDSYRRIQVIHHLIKNGNLHKNDIGFKNGKIVSLPIEKQKLEEILSDGKAFMTAGCDGCNRPYYNEKPGSTIYNYPRQMTEDEVRQAIFCILP